jgi:hypothetical protein
LNADLVQSTASVGACSFNGGTLLGCETGSTNSQPGVSAQTSFSGSLSNSGEVVNVTGSTSSDKGALKGSITTVVTSGVPPATELDGEAAAFMIDTITIPDPSDPSLNGQTESLVMGLNADWTGSGPELVNPGMYTAAALHLYAGAAVAGLPAGSTYLSNGSPLVSSFISAPISFTLGAPFSIEWYFEATSGASCTNAAACASWNSNGMAASVNASDTVTLNSFNVYNSSGGLISPSDWSVTSASGLQYGPTGIVPEPSIWLPLLAILGVLGLKLRLRSRLLCRETIEDSHEQSNLYVASHGN